MSCDTHEFFSKFKKDVTKIKQEIPETLNGFATLFSKIMTDGNLTLREKELIALGIAVAIQCEPCIKLHVQKCLDAGATRAQVLEAASVSVMMGGGPAYTHLPMVLDTLDAIEGK